MKANELMPCDRVLYKGRVIIVTAIDALSHAIRGVYADDSEDTGWFNEDLASPILLTEEILKANEFECPFEDGVFELRSMEYSIYVCLKRHCINIQVNFREIADEAFIRVHCNYVHELQHALRLCGLNELADNFKIKQNQ